MKISRATIAATMTLFLSGIGADGCGFFWPGGNGGSAPSPSPPPPSCGTLQGQGGDDGYGGAPGAGGGDVGVSVADVGVGVGPGGGDPGYSPQTSSCDGDQGIGMPADAYINCVAKGLSAAACAEACAAVGAACGPIAAHPERAGEGTGQLTYCKNGGPTFTCTYTFPSGDGCARILSPLGSRWLCFYKGGK
jgi:hypothetical protein